MVTIFNRRFVQRSLPALLALILGFLVAPQPAVPSAIALPGPSAAADLEATTRTTAADVAVHTGHSTPMAPPPAESAAPHDLSADSTEQISAGPHTLRAQVTVRTLGSRAPPSALA
jgi:hypothetical protein